jgi:hypothetical protein
MNMWRSDYNQMKKYAEDNEKFPFFNMEFKKPPDVLGF